MQDIVEKIQQGNWTAEDVDRAVLEIIRLRKELAEAMRQLNRTYKYPNLDNL